MASWAQRMHKRAADLGSVVTSCGHPGQGPYPHRLEKVKFGVPLDEVCKNDIPGPLLVLILKLNKEAPQRKDVFRAPGHQGAMKKLIHFLQAGRLVNVDNYSVYTIASVLKKFLRKIPNGIFGRDGESQLFAIVELEDEMEQQERIHRLIMSLPHYTQRLLVLLFGTFRVIATNAERSGTGMTSEALGVSVAPSFFQSCVSDGKTAKMEDVSKFKVATKIMKQMIDQFAAYDLFGRENYEFYARVTGRILKVQDEWICSFQYPEPPIGKTAQQTYAVQLSLEAEKTWLQCECERWGLIAQEESQSTPALLTSSSSAIGNSTLSLGIIPEHSLLESCTRLSISLEGPSVFGMASSQLASSSNNKGVGGGQCSIASGGRSGGIKNASNCSSGRSSQSASLPSHHMTMDELRAVNRYAESTKSLSYLPQVHERQAARMRTRSEWFLGAAEGSLELAEIDHPYYCGSTDDLHDDSNNSELGNNTMYLLMHHQQQFQMQHQNQQQQQQQHQQQQQQNSNNLPDAEQWKKPYERSYSSDHAVTLMETNFPPISGTFDEQHVNKNFINNNNNNNQHNNIDSNISNSNRQNNNNYNNNYGTDNIVNNRNTIDCDIILHHRRPSTDTDDDDDDTMRLNTTSDTNRNRRRYPHNHRNHDEHVVRFARSPPTRSSSQPPSSISNRSLSHNDDSIMSLPSNHEEVDYIITARSRRTTTSSNRNQNHNQNQQQQSGVVSMLFTVLDFLF